MDTTYLQPYRIGCCPKIGARVMVLPAAKRVCAFPLQRFVRKIHSRARIVMITTPRSRPLAWMTRDVLSGFTIRNGDTDEGGVLGDGTNATMANNVITADTSVHDDCEFARRNEIIEGDMTSESRSQYGGGAGRNLSDVARPAKDFVKKPLEKVRKEGESRCTSQPLQQSSSLPFTASA
jgi:hypothetical protein